MKGFIIPPIVSPIGPVELKSIGKIVIFVIKYGSKNDDIKNNAENNIKKIEILSKVSKFSFFFEFCFIRLQITEKVFAKGGLNLTASSISTERSKLLFQITKLQKKVI